MIIIAYSVKQSRSLFSFIIITISRTKLVRSQLASLINITSIKQLYLTYKNQVTLLQLTLKSNLGISEEAGTLYELLVLLQWLESKG